MESGWTKVTSRYNRQKSKSDSAMPRTNKKVNTWNESRCKVDLYRPDGTTLIMASLSLKKLQRYSLFARAHTPLDSSPYSPDEPALRVTMPRSGGKEEPTREAIIWLLNFLIERAEDEHTPALHFNNMKMNLRQAINVYVAGEALQVTVKMHPLRTEIHTIMINKPIFDHELECVLSVMPLEHGLVNSAVQSLTYFYFGYRISGAHNRALEAMIYRYPEVGAMFDAELGRQMDLQAAGTKRIHEARRSEQRGIVSEVQAKSETPRSPEQPLAELLDFTKRVTMSAEIAAAKIEAKHRAEEAAAVARKLEDVRHRKHRFMQFGISLRDANMVYGSTISEILTKC